MDTQAIEDSQSLETVSIIIVNSQVLLNTFLDQNTLFIRMWAYELGLDVIETKVVRNDQDDIMTAVVGGTDTADLVVVVGGTGPGVHDVTYEAVSRALEVGREYHDKTFDRLKSAVSSTYPDFNWEEPSPKLDRLARLAYLPIGNQPDEECVIHPVEDEWKPLVFLDQRVLIAPGTPFLLRKLLIAFGPRLKARVPEPFTERASISIRTVRPEIDLGDLVEEFNARAEAEGNGVFATTHPEPVAHSCTVVVVYGPNREAIAGIATDFAATFNGIVVTARRSRQSPPPKDPRFDRDARAILQGVVHDGLRLIGREEDMTPDAVEYLINKTTLLRGAYFPEVAPHAARESATMETI